MDTHPHLATAKPLTSAKALNACNQQLACMSAVSAPLTASYRPQLCPVLLLQVLNKTDLVETSRVQELQSYFAANNLCEAVLPAAALSGTGVEEVKQWALAALPLGPTLYPKVQMLDVSCHHRGSCRGSRAACSLLGLRAVGVPAYHRSVTVCHVCVYAG